MTNEVDRLKIQLEEAKTNAAYWEERWRNTNTDLCFQCSVTSKMRNKIFELTGEWLDSNMQSVDIGKLKRMYDNIGSPLD